MTGDEDSRDDEQPPRERSNTESALLSFVGAVAGQDTKDQLRLAVDNLVPNASADQLDAAAVQALQDGMAIAEADTPEEQPPETPETQSHFVVGEDSGEEVGKIIVVFDSDARLMQDIEHSMVTVKDRHGRTQDFHLPFDISHVDTETYTQEGYKKYVVWSNDHDIPALEGGEGEDG